MSDAAVRRQSSSLSRGDMLKMIQVAADTGAVPDPTPMELPPAPDTLGLLKGAAERSHQELLKHAPASVANLSTEDRAYAATMTVEYGQGHIFAAWPAAGIDDDQKRACLAQCRQLEESYPGGLRAYVASARTLLGQSQRGENPLDGWTPSVPADGFDLTPGTPEYEAYEKVGIAEAGKLGFVVPAGGLGERLGYHGVKFALPADISTNACVLSVCAPHARPPPPPRTLARCARARCTRVRCAALSERTP